MKIRTKKLLVACAPYLGGFCIAAAVFLSSGLSVLILDNHSQLASIAAIEIELLGKWQQSGSLKGNLAYNSEGSDVALLQRMLSQDPVAYPEGKISGHFSDLTLGAVKKFQREYGLAESGAVDSETRHKLNGIFLSHLCPEPISTYPDLFMKKIGIHAPVPSDYAPPLLEDISTKVKTAGVVCLRSDVLPHVVRMFADAQRDGVDLMITSGYRKPEIQKRLYDFWIQVEGPGAVDEIAEPGLSEHQLGTAIDLTDSSIYFTGVDRRFAKSSGGIWLQTNAHRYGFTMSFRGEKRSATRFTYEPWHWRFVGVEAARALHEQGLAYDETSFDSSGFPPLRSNIQGISLSAHSFLSVFVGSGGDEKVLIEKNKDKQLPIAGVPSLMIALVASDQYDNDDIVSISEESLRNDDLSGIYKTGDQFFFSDALHALLLASHGEIASAMTERVGASKFRDAMNQKARTIGLPSTVFINATGLDPAIGGGPADVSTVFDTYKLARHVQENHPDLFSIMARRDFHLFDSDRNFVATIGNANKLIGRQSAPFRFLGGNASEASRAKQDSVIVSSSPCGGKVFSVILSSQNSFEDMQKLLRYIRDSYEWTCPS